MGITQIQRWARSQKNIFFIGRKGTQKRCFKKCRKWNKVNIELYPRAKHTYGQQKVMPGIVQAIHGN